MVKKGNNNKLNKLLPTRQKMVGKRALKNYMTKIKYNKVRVP
jgi:hypothetical protein